MHFYGIKFESKNLFEIFVVNSLNYSFFKRFFLINFDKVVFLRTQIDTSICVLNIFNWLGFYVSKYFILELRTFILINV